MELQSVPIMTGSTDSGGPLRAQQQHQQQSAFFFHPLQSGKMTPSPHQLQQQQPIQLTPLWEHVVRTRSFPTDVDIFSTFLEISERLRDPEWEVRQHALRVLIDVLPTLESDIDVCVETVFQELINNLGHTAPAVRKGALDTLRVYLHYSKQREQKVQMILDSCLTAPAISSSCCPQTNITTGVILSTPSLLYPSSTCPKPSIQLLEKTIDQLIPYFLEPSFQEPTAKSLLKIQQLLGRESFQQILKGLQPEVAEKLGNFAVSQNKIDESESGKQEAIEMLELENGSSPGSARVVLETEIKFNEETAITMTILEEQRQSRRIRRVHFGGEVVKLRTPDSDESLEPSRIPLPVAPATRMPKTARKSRSASSSPKRSNSRRSRGSSGHVHTADLSPGKSILSRSGSPLLQRKSSSLNELDQLKADQDFAGEEFLPSRNFWNSSKAFRVCREDFPEAPEVSEVPEIFRISGSPGNLGKLENEGISGDPGTPGSPGNKETAGVPENPGISPASGTPEIPENLGDLESPESPTAGNSEERKKNKRMKRNFREFENEDFGARKEEIKGLEGPAGGRICGQEEETWSPGRIKSQSAKEDRRWSQELVQKSGKAQSAKEKRSKVPQASRFRDQSSRDSREKLEEDLENSRIVVPVSENSKIVSGGKGNSKIVEPVPENSKIILPVPENSKIVIPVPETPSLMSPVPKTPSLMSPVPENSEIVTPVSENSKIVTPVSENSPSLSPVPKTPNSMLPVPKTPNLISQVPENPSLIPSVPETSSSVPPVPENSSSVPPVPENSSLVSPVLENISSVPPVPENSSLTPQVPENLSSVPPVPENSSSPKKSTASRSFARRSPSFEAFPRQERNYILMELSSPTKKADRSGNVFGTLVNDKENETEAQLSLEIHGSGLRADGQCRNGEFGGGEEEEADFEEEEERKFDEAEDDEDLEIELSGDRRRNGPGAEIGAGGAAGAGICCESEMGPKCEESSWEELGLVDREVLEDLHDKDDWRARVRALERIASVLRTSSALIAIEPRLGSLLQAVLGGERSCRVAAAGLAVARVAITGVSQEALKRRLPELAWGLSRQGGPNAAQLARIAMLRLRPALLLEQFLQPHCIGARNAKTRENALQLLIFSLVTFPSTEFKVDVVANKVAMLVGDRRRRVRQAALDTLAVLAQIYEHEEVLEAGKRAAKGRRDGDEMIAAIRARLARKSLPLVSADGLVVYGLQISPTVQIATGPDVDWIVAGSGSVSPGTGRTRGQIIATASRLDTAQYNRTENNNDSTWLEQQNFLALGIGIHPETEQQPVAWQLIPPSRQETRRLLESHRLWASEDRIDDISGDRNSDNNLRSSGKPRRFSTASSKAYERCESESLNSSESAPEIQQSSSFSIETIRNGEKSRIPVFSRHTKDRNVMNRSETDSSTQSGEIFRKKMLDVFEDSRPPIPRDSNFGYAAMYQRRKRLAEENAFQSFLPKSNLISGENDRKNSFYRPVSNKRTTMGQQCREFTSKNKGGKSSGRRKNFSISESSVYLPKSDSSSSQEISSYDTDKAVVEEEGFNDRNRNISQSAQTYRLRNSSNRGIQDSGEIIGELTSSSSENDELESRRTFDVITLPNSSPKTHLESAHEICSTRESTKIPIEISQEEVLREEFSSEEDLINNNNNINNNNHNNNNNDSSNESRETTNGERMILSRCKSVNSIVSITEFREDENGRQIIRNYLSNESIHSNYSTKESNNSRNSSSFSRKAKETNDGNSNYSNDFLENSRSHSRGFEGSPRKTVAFTDTPEKSLISDEETNEIEKEEEIPPSTLPDVSSFENLHNNNNNLIDDPNSPSIVIASRPHSNETKQQIRSEISSNVGPSQAYNEIYPPKLPTAPTEVPKRLPPSRVPRVTGAKLRNRGTPMTMASMEKRELEKSKVMLQQCFEQLESKDWEATIRGLKSLSRIINERVELLENCTSGTLGRLLGRHIANLRSQVSRAACHAAGDIFASHIRTMDQDLDDIASALLHRTADTNRFLRADSNAALDRMIEHLPPNRTIGIIVLRGANHQNSIVRAATARLLADLVERIGAEQTMILHRDVRNKLLYTGAKLLIDGNLDARNHAKRMFRKLRHCEGFRRALIDSVPETTLRHIDKTLKSL